MTDRITTLASQADEVATGLIAHLQALPPADWSGPSDCQGWSIAAVVAHLVMVEEMFGSSILCGLQGDTSPRPQAFESRAAWLEYREREIERLSRQGPAELLQQLGAGLQPMREALMSLAAAGATGRQGWHPGGLQPLPWFAGQWLFEIALHDWDIRVAADPAAILNAAAYPSLGPELRARMPRYFRPADGPGPSGTVRIHLVSAEGGSSASGTTVTAWLARLGDGGLDLLDDGAAEPDATIEADPGTYALVQSARRPADQVQAGGRWRVTGDTHLVERLVSSFAGF